MEGILRTLLVSGKGREKIPVTSAQMRLAIEARGSVATEVQQEIARKSSTVVDLLRLVDVKQLKTLGIQLGTYYEYPKDVIKQMEYRGSNTIAFSLLIHNAAIALDEAVKAGANGINEISFIATDEAINAAKQEALLKATIDAKVKAETVLSTLDLTLKEIISIEIDRDRVQEVKPIIRHRRRKGRSTSPGDESSFKMPVVGGEITVDASVTLQISY